MDSRRGYERHGDDVRPHGRRTCAGDRQRGDGIGRLVKEKCDFLVSIPMFGQIDSLNAAVAAAVLMFEKRRQDGIRKN